MENLVFRQEYLLWGQYLRVSITTLSCIVCRILTNVQRHLQCCYWGCGGPWLGARGWRQWRPATSPSRLPSLFTLLKLPHYLRTTALILQQAAIARPWLRRHNLLSATIQHKRSLKPHEQMFGDCKVRFAYVSWKTWKMFFPYRVCMQNGLTRQPNLILTSASFHAKIMQPMIFVSITWSNWRSSRSSLAGVDSKSWISTRTSLALIWKQTHKAKSTGNSCFNPADICRHSLHSLHCNFKSFKRVSTCHNPSYVSFLSLSSSLDAVDQTVLEFCQGLELAELGVRVRNMMHCRILFRLHALPTFFLFLALEADTHLPFLWGSHNEVTLKWVQRRGRQLSDTLSHTCSPSLWQSQSCFQA